MADAINTPLGKAVERQHISSGGDHSAMVADLLDPAAATADDAPQATTVQVLQRIWGIAHIVSARRRRHIQIRL